MDLDEANAINSITDIKKFLSTPDNPVTTAEMSEFWSSLSDEEKAEFKNTELPSE
jgi:hypothetical protein